MIIDNGTHHMKKQRRLSGRNKRIAADYHLKIIEANHHLRKVIDKSDYTLTQLAHFFRVRQSAVSNWLRERVPAIHVVDLCNLLEGKVTPSELRPDVFKRYSY